MQSLAVDVTAGISGFIFYPGMIKNRHAAVVWHIENVVGAGAVGKSRYLPG